jgi:hypothetical protein
MANVFTYSPNPVAIPYDDNEMKTVTIDVVKEVTKEAEKPIEPLPRSKANIVMALILYAFACGTIVLLALYGKDELDFNYITGDIADPNKLRVGIPVVTTCICAICACVLFGMHFHSYFHRKATIKSCGVCAIIPVSALLGVIASSTVAFVETCNYSHDECFNTRKLYVVNLIYFFASCAGVLLFLLSYCSRLFTDLFS